MREMREISEVRAKLELLLDFLYAICEDLVYLKNKLELIEGEHDSISDDEKACRRKSKD